MRPPTRLYKQDPGRNPPAEWVEVSYGRSTRGGWRVHENWGAGGEKSTTCTEHEPWLSESEANAALDTRIGELAKDGWKHSLTPVLDRNSGALVYQRTS
jgi:hypothetical protein